MNHLLGSLNYRGTNTRLSEQNSKKFSFVNSAFAAAKHCFAVANPWVANLAILLHRGKAAHAAVKSFAAAWVPLLRRRSPTLVFPLRDFSSKILKNSTKTWGSLPMTSKYHPKPNMSKNHGWLRVFLTQKSLTTF